MASLTSQYAIGDQVFVNLRHRLTNAFEWIYGVVVGGYENRDEIYVQPINAMCKIQFICNRAYQIKKYNM